MEVEREWDANAIATLLGAKLGESQRKVIQREVPLLLERIKRLEAAGDAMLNAWLMPEDSMEYCDWVALSADAKAMWYKAKEAKP